MGKLTKNENGEFINEDGLTFSEFTALERYIEGKSEASKNHNAAQANSGKTRDDFDADVRNKNKEKTGNTVSQLLPEPEEKTAPSGESVAEYLPLPGNEKEKNTVKLPSPMQDRSTLETEQIEFEEPERRKYYTLPGLDTYSEDAAKASEAVKASEVAMNSASTLKTAAEKMVGARLDAYNDAEKRLTEKSIAIEDMKGRIDSADSIIKEYDTAANGYNSVADELEQITSEYNTQYTKAEKQLNDYIKNLEELEKTYSASPTEENAGKYNAVADAYNKLLEETKLLYENYSTNYSNAEKRLNEYMATVDTLAAKYKELVPDGFMEEYNKAVDDYNAILSEMTGITAEYDKYLAEYGDILQLYDRKYAKYEEQLNSYNEIVKQYNSWRATVRSTAEIQPEVDALSTAIDTLEMKISKAKNRRNTLFSKSSRNTTASKKEIAELDSSIEKYNAELEALRSKYDLTLEELGVSEEFEKAEYYASFTERADFAEKSKYTRSTWKSEEPETILTAQEAVYSGRNASALYDDIIYDLVNRNEVAIKISEAEDLYYKNNIWDKQYLYCLNETEQAIFNYIYATDKEEAHSFIEHLKPELLERWREYHEKGYSDYANANPVSSSIFSVALNLNKPQVLLNQFADYAPDGKIEANATYNAPALTTNALREGASADMNGFASFLYQTGMSLADFATVTALTGGSGASLAIMGMSSAADTVIEAKDRGLDDSQAVTLGLAAGLIEAATEKIGLDELMKGIGKGRGFLTNLLRNAGAEAGEELLSSIGNDIVDMFVSKDMSEWNQAIERYMKEDSTLTRDEAWSKVCGEHLLEYVLAAAGGALSGGITGTGTSVIDSVGKTYEKINVQKELGKILQKDTEGRDALINAAKALPDNSKAHKLALEIESVIEKGKLPTASQLSKLDKLFTKELDKIEKKNSSAAEAETVEENTEAETVEENTDTSAATDEKTVPETYEIVKEAKNAPLYTEYHMLAEQIEKKGTATAEEMHRLDELWKARQRTPQAIEHVKYAADGGNNSLETVTDIIRKEYSFDTISDAEIEDAYNEAVAPSAPEENTLDTPNYENNNGNIASTDTTFAADDDNSSTEDLSVRDAAAVDKIKNAIPELSEMDSVISLTGNEFPKSNKKLTEQVGEFFASLKNKITRKGFGEVVISNDGIKSSIAHGLGRAKAVTFAAVPDVIANGKQIDYQENWKGRGYNTYIFAAPVQIGEKTGYVGAVVTQSEETNKYYLHEVIDSEGNIFKISKDADLFKTGSFTDNSASTSKSASSDNSIPQKSDLDNTFDEKNNESADFRNESTENDNADDLDAPTENEVTKRNNEIKEEMKYSSGDPAVNKFYADEGAMTERLRAEGTLKDHPLYHARGETARSGYVYGASESDIAIADRLSKALGRDILFFSEEARNDHIKNGVLDRDIIWINAKHDPDKTVTWIIAHELTHTIENTKAYNKLKDYVFDILGEEEVKRQRTELLDLYDRREIDYEIVSNYVADHLLTDEAAIIKLVQRNRSLGQKIKSILANILDKLGVGGKKTEEYIALEKVYKTYQKALAEQANAQKKTDGAASESERAKEKAIDPDDVLNDDYIKNARERFKRGEITQDELNRLVDEYLADSDIQYNSKNSIVRHSYSTAEDASTKEQLREHSDKLNTMDTVCDIKYNVTNRGKARIDAEEVFKKSGFKIDRQGFGIIEISPNELSGSTKYLDTPAEFAAWMSVPKVLKRGIIISGHENHKQRGFPTVTIAAPVTINGKRGNVAVVVQKKGKNKYHMHRILMPDGSKFVYESIQENAEPTVDSIEEKASPKRLSISSASGNIISQNTKMSTDLQKKNQLDIINQTNPAPNTYSTWVRSVDDIKTFEEALFDDEYADYDEFNPDYNRKMAEEALDGGNITVYSSYPIKNGVFVTPSKMEAESYSGNGKVYSKSVLIGDVAWIDITQGQYANVTEQGENNFPFSKNAKSSKSDTSDSLTAFAEKSRSEYLEVTENLNAKSREFLTRRENEFIRKIGAVLHLSPDTKRGIVRDVARGIVAEQIGNGAVTEDVARDLFEYAYNEGTVKDDEYYNQYKSLKDQLRKTAITLSARDMSDLGDPKAFKESARGKLNIKKEGGLPVDSAYMELMEQYPELFPAEITHPADQLQRMLDVANDIKVKEMSLDEHFGENAEEAKEWMWNDFNQAVTDFTREIGFGKKYIENLAERMAQEGIVVPNAETLFEAYKNLKKLRADASKAVARNVLTPVEENYVRDLLIGRLTFDQIPAEHYNFFGIKQVYEAKLPYEYASKVIEAYHNKRKRDQYARADELLEGFEDWKAKKMGLTLSMNTMERNFYDMIKDTDRAQAMIDEYIAPIHKHEAQSTRYKNKLLDKIRSLNISQKVAKGNRDTEAAAVQFIGEAESHIMRLESNKRLKKSGGMTLEEWQEALSDFKIANPELDYDRINKCVRTFREIYDQLFDDMNKARMLNGYEPIDYRYAYFPHFHKDIPTSFWGRFAEVLGVPQDTQNLPATIAGMTENFKPGIRWLSAAQERRLTDTEYDCLEGFDRYIGGAADVIFHTEDIQKLRSLANRIRYGASDDALRRRMEVIEANEDLSDEDKHEQIAKIAESKFTLSAFVNELDEYTNLLAGKKSRADRISEQDMGRNFYNYAAWLKKHFGANMIAGNIGSAMTNFIPIAQAAGITKHQMLKAMYAQIKSMAVDDGFADRSDFLTNRIVGTDTLSKKTSDKISDILGTPVELIDGFSSGTIVRALYAQAKKSGLSDAEAMAQANTRAAEIMADRSKGAMPTIFSRSNFLTGIMTQFQLEVANQYAYMFKDLPRYYSGDKRKMLKVIASLFKIFILSYLFNDIYEALVGRRAAFDPIDIVNNAIGDATGYQLPNMFDAIGDIIAGDDISDVFKTEKKGVATAIKDTVTDTAQELPFVGGLLGGGRIPISSAMPDIGTLYDTFTSDASGKKKLKTLVGELDSLLYVLPPFGGGQVRKTLDAIPSIVQGGSYTYDNEGNRRLQYPTQTGNTVSDVVEAGRSVIFGKSSSRYAREWVESDFDTFTVKETIAYEEIVDRGFAKNVSFNSIKDYNSLRGKSTRTADKIDVLKNMDVDIDIKYVIYKHLIASEDAALKLDGRLAEFDEHGLDFNDYLEVIQADSRFFQGDTKKANLFSMVDSGVSISDALSSISNNAKSDLTDSETKIVTALNDAGLSPEESLAVVNDFDGIEPTCGRKKASQYQKAKVITNSVKDEKKQLDVIKEVMSEKQYKIMKLAWEEYHIEPKFYIDVYLAAENLSYETTGKTEVCKDELKAVLDDLELIDGKKAQLYQFITAEDVVMNPYSFQHAKFVFDDMAALFA